jgi:hypothetical protein
MGYLVEGLELLIRKVAYTKYDATGLVPWSNLYHYLSVVKFISESCFSGGCDWTAAIEQGFHDRPSA